MPKTQSPPFEPSLIFLIFISLFGLALSFIFVTIPRGTTDDFALRKPIVGLVFGSLCIIGTLASIYPSKCSRLFDYEKGKHHEKASANLQEPTIRGHHPSCENYSTHTLKVGNQVLCATCTGFSVGAIIALIGVGLFFLGPLSFGTKQFIPLSIGALGVSIGLLHSILPGFKIGFFRFLASAFFATGSFLVIASVEDALHNTSIDLFFVFLSVLWLVADTALSRWDHRRICSKCTVESCSRKAIR
jgi:hypothetical protein